jgi:hypothetical protein
MRSLHYNFFFAWTRHFELILLNAVLALEWTGLNVVFIAWLFESEVVVPTEPTGGRIEIATGVLKDNCCGMCAMRCCRAGIEWIDT